MFFKFHVRIMEIIKIIEIHLIIIYIKKKNDNHEKHENLSISYKNNEKHKNLRIAFENHYNHENFILRNENQANHEKLKKILRGSRNSTKC